MTINDMPDLLTMGESPTMEFKSSFDKAAIETLTAFSNTSGGTVLIGVDDRGIIKGVETGKETIQNWQNQIKLSTSPSLFPEIETSLFDGKTIVALKIPEHPIKPVSCRGKYYQRKNNSNHQMTISEIADTHLKTFNTSWDFYPDPHHSIEDISLDKINNFIERANDIRVHPIDDDPFTVLKKYELLKQDKITHGCHLLFMVAESALSSIQAGRFSSDTVIKDNLTLRTDLITEVDLIVEFIQKHISRGYHFTGKEGV